MMEIPTPKRNNREDGQVLPIAAFALIAIIALLLFGVRIAYLYSADSFLRQRVDFAAAAAARPDGDALSGGIVRIDEVKGAASAKAELLSSFSQMEFVGATAAELMAMATIEFLNPTGGACEQFTGDTTCYTVPAVRVRATVPFDLFGFTINLKREGLATIAAQPGDGGTGSSPPIPTPIVLPTEVFVPTPTTPP